MENGTSSLLDNLHEFLDKHQDPRTKDLYLMSSPIPTLVGVFIYLYLIKVLLPGYMKGRKAYTLQSFIIAYNFLQVLFSAGLFIGFLAAGWLPPKYDISCKQFTKPGTIEGNGLKMIHITYVYYLSKFTEFFDTILFILRKKDSQVTFLHVYHHGIMPIWTWGVTKYLPDAQITLYGCINSFIHVVMYTYYLLSSMGPQMQKYLWWKKYITVIQLIQFSVGIVHSAHMFINGCNFPKALSLLFMAEAIFFFMMFFKFYLKTYRKETKKSNTSVGNHANIKKEI